MLLNVTDPAILAQYPHLAPPKLEVIDMVATVDGDKTTYAINPGTPEAGHGRLTQCALCGTFLRTGQPHTATQPEPHTAFDMLRVVEPEIAE
jgi:hypothetical protein